MASQTLAARIDYALDVLAIPLARSERTVTFVNANSSRNLTVSYGLMHQQLNPMTNWVVRAVTEPFFSAPPEGGNSALRIVRQVVAFNDLQACSLAALLYSASDILGYLGNILMTPLALAVRVATFVTMTLFATVIGVPLAIVLSPFMLIAFLVMRMGSSSLPQGQPQLPQQLP